MDDVSGCEKLHMNNVCTSKYFAEKETRYVHAKQGQNLFDPVALKTANRGMKKSHFKRNNYERRHSTGTGVPECLGKREPIVVYLSY